MESESSAVTKETHLSDAGFGNLPNHWSVIEVEETLSGDRGISVGVMYPGKHDPNGVPLVKAGDLSGNTLKTTPEFRISPKKHEEYQRTEFQGGELLMTLVGTIGQCAIVKPSMKGWNSARAVAVLRLEDGSDAAFLRYCFVSPQLNYLMNAWANTTVQTTLNLKEIRKLPVPWPPKSERDAIASILGSLDDKIELNRRMNETLESMARAIFKSWFVDFDPVRAKMDGRQPAGMDQATADLFPDAFEDSPLGQIPAGWSAAPFKKHVTVERGLSYKGSGLSDSGVPMHNLNSILEGGGYKYAGIKFYAGDYKEKHVVVPGDLIVTNTEQGFNHLLIGHAAIVPEQFGAMGIFSHHIYRVRLIEDSPLSPQYFVHLINMRRWHELIAGFSNGTTINMLPKDALEKPMLIEPPKELVSKFTDFANTSAQRTEHSVVQNARLAILRDTLLPKLLSGELRVKDAEKAVSSAL